MGVVEGGPGGGSVWRVPGMPWLLGSAMLWFAGFALLVPVAPLWVIRGGSDDLGAGLVTGVMMACTVLAQLSMRRVLAGLGWRWTLVLGAGLLGLPALGHLATDRLWPVIALAAVRGFGFGIVTVCGATAVASFVGPAAAAGPSAPSGWRSPHLSSSSSRSRPGLPNGPGSGWSSCWPSSRRSPYRWPGRSHEPWATVTARRPTTPDMARGPGCGACWPGRSRHWS